MDSVRRGSVVPLVEIKPDQEGLLARIAAPPPSHAEAKSRGATAGANTYQDADECLMIESAAERSNNLRCVERFRESQFGDVLWVREEPIEVAVVDGDAATRLFLQRILEQSGGYRCVGTFASGEEALRKIPG